MIEKPNDSTNQSLTNEHPSSQAEKTTSGTQESNVEEVVNQVLERKQTIQNLTRLRNRINWLTGFFAIAVIILGGGLAWVSYSLQKQEKQVNTQIRQLQEQTPDPEKIQSLENQVDKLNSAIDNNQQTLEKILKENQIQGSQEEDQNQSSQEEDQNQVSREDIEYYFQAE